MHLICSETLVPICTRVGLPSCLDGRTLADAANERTGTWAWFPISAAKAACCHVSMPTITCTFFSLISSSAAIICYKLHWLYSTFILSVLTNVFIFELIIELKKLLIHESMVGPLIKSLSNQWHHKYILLFKIYINKLKFNNIYFLFVILSNISI